jgi:hypothetical protein
MTIKGRIEKLERKAPEREAHQIRFGNLADQLRRARLRAGLPEPSKALMVRKPDWRELSIADRLDVARMRNRERLFPKREMDGPEK